MHRFVNMIHTIKKYILPVILFALCCTFMTGGTTVQASDLSASDDLYAYEYTNESTHYKALLEDDADLLSETEETALFEAMQPITEYGNVAFKSVDQNSTDTDSIAQIYYNKHFGSDSGTVFVIDMDNRNIYIHSDGSMYRTITKSMAYTITDNVYTYATDGDYYSCAYHAYSQILTKMEGGKVAQPMKYTSNIFLALLLALLINYFFVKATSKAKKVKDDELLSNLPMQCMVTNARTQFTHQTKRYDPPSSSGGGGGGRSGGGGGGRSGGGGGHRF